MNNHTPTKRSTLSLHPISPISRPLSAPSPSKVSIKLKKDLDASKRHKFINSGPRKIKDVFMSSSDAGDFKQIESPINQRKACNIPQQMETKDIVVLVEHCHECEKHNSLSLRHDPKQYLDKSKKVLRDLARAVHSCCLNIRFGVARMPCSSNSSRLGSCEVLIIHKDKNNNFSFELIHSKLETGYWPDKDMIVKRAIDFIADQNIAKFASSVERKYDTTIPYPVGFGSFKETKLYDPGWQSIPNIGEDELCQIEWVFDSRQNFWNEDNIFSYKKIYGNTDINDQLLGAEILSENVGLKGCPVDIIAYDDVGSFTVELDDLHYICSDMLKKVTKDNNIGIYAQLSNLDNNSVHETYVDAILIAESNTTIATIKYQIKFNSEDDAFEISSYGEKKISFGNDDGIVFAEFDIYITPSQSNLSLIRAPEKFVFYNKITNSLIDKIINVVFIRKSSETYYTNDISLDGTVTSISRVVENGYLNLPVEIHNGIWSMETKTTSFKLEKKSIDFIYFDKNENEEVVILRPCLKVDKSSLKPNNRLISFINKSKDTYMTTLPDILIFGEIYLFRIDFETLESMGDGKFKESILKEKQYLTVLVELEFGTEKKDIIIEAVATQDRTNGDAIIALTATTTTSKASTKEAEIFYAIKKFRMFKNIQFAGRDGLVFWIKNNIKFQIPSREDIKIDTNQKDIVIPEGCLMVYPSSEEVYVDVSLQIADNFQYLGTLQSDKFIQLSFLESCPENCIFKCTTFLIPGKSSQSIDPIDLQNGLYSCHTGKVSDIIILKEFTVKKRKNQILPNFVDSGANIIKIEVIYKDEKLKNQSVAVTYSPEVNPNPKPYVFEGMSTDKDGIVVIILPANGNVNMSMLTSSGGEIHFSEKLSHRSCFNDISEKIDDIFIRRLFESNVIVTIDNSHPISRPILLLGDISGSMDDGDRMIALRATYESIFKHCIEKHIKVGFVVWGSSVFYCCPGTPSNQWESDGNENSSIQYLKEKDSDNIFEWIQNLKPNGFTYMRFAIEDSLLKYPDAKDIYVICDGDVAPFSIGTTGRDIDKSDKLSIPYFTNEEEFNIAKEDLISWKSFIKRYDSDVKFHFIALSNGAENEQMKKMSEIANGIYTAANKNN